MKKIEKDLDNFDIGNWKSEVGIFQALDLGLEYEKVLFSTQLGYHLMWKLLKNSEMSSNVKFLCYDIYFDDALCYLVHCQENENSNC